MTKDEQTQLIELAKEKGVRVQAIEYDGDFAVRVGPFVTYNVEHARLAIAATAGGHISVEKVGG